MTADQQRLAVGHPDGAQNISVDRARGVLPVASGSGGRENFVFVGAVAVPWIPVGKLASVRRERAEAFKLLVFREFADVAGLGIQYLQGPLVAVSRVRVFLLSEGDEFPVGRPGKRRRRRTRRQNFWEAPRTGSQTPGFSALGSNKPDVGRQSRFCFEITIVANFEGIQMLLNFLFVSGLVRGDESDVVSVRPPGELFYTTGRVGDFLGIAPAHGKNENLSFFFLGGTNGSQEGNSI